MKHVFLAGVFAAMSAVSASAATTDLTFDDLVFDGGQIQNGNCPFDEAPCIRLNRNDVVTVSLVGGGTFDLDSFAYTLQGSPSQISVMSNLADTSAVPPIGIFQDLNEQGNSGDLIADLTGIVGFTDILSVTFSNIGTGTLRIGSFTGTIPMDMAPVPLPAAGLMLLTALGGAAALRRRG